LRFDSSSLVLLARGGRWLALAFIAVLFAACSTIRIGYNHADSLLLHQLERYVDLTADQQHIVKQRMAALMAWHRGTQLPDYAAFLQQTRSRLAGPITAVEVLEFNEALNRRLALMGDRIAPDFAALSLTLSPAQIDQIERKLVDDNVKARKESAREVKQAIDERAKKYAERSEFWFGRLTPEQMQIVRTSLANRPGDSLYWIEARERRTRDLVTLLRRIRAEHPSEDTAARWIRA
jgi:hypothetical protein